MGLVGLFIVMMIPSGLANVQDEPKHYGFATLDVRDVNGNTVFEQTVHNLITDEGELALAVGIFRNGVAGDDEVDADKIDTICITLETSFAEVEALTASAFNGADATTSTNCISGVATVPVTAQAGANDNKGTLQFTFDAPTHLPNDATLTGIGICSDEGKSGPPFNECSTAGMDLLATINTSDVQLGSGETVQITYVMDFE